MSWDEVGRQRDVPGDHGSRNKWDIYIQVKGTRNRSGGAQGIPMQNFTLVPCYGYTIE